MAGNLGVYIYFQLCFVLHSIKVSLLNFCVAKTHTHIYIYIYHIKDTVGAAPCSEKELHSFIDFVTNFNPSIKYADSISNNTANSLYLQLTIDSKYNN